MFSTIVHGARYSLSLVAMAATLSLVVGVLAVWRRATCVAGSTRS
jgi:ABC-type dipeptide/oligopeptide/nickel transport system permease subunit